MDSPAEPQEGTTFTGLQASGLENCKRIISVVLCHLAYDNLLQESQETNIFIIVHLDFYLYHKSCELLEGKSCFVPRQISYSLTQCLAQMEEHLKCLLEKLMRPNQLDAEGKEPLKLVLQQEDFC